MTLQEFFDSYYATVSKGDLDELKVFYTTSSPLFETNYQQFSAMRQQFDFSLSVQSIGLLSKQDDLLIARDELRFDAVIEGNEVVQVSTNIHILTRENGEWKIFNSALIPEQKVA